MWFPALADLVAANDELVDFVEFEPVTRLAATPDVGKPVVVHGVTCAVGGSVPPAYADMRALADVAARVDSPWVSDHLSVNRFESDVDTGFFLPPAQTSDAVAVAARNIRALRQVVRRPVAFETGVNYLRPRENQLPDGDFFAAVAEAANCLILCDVHNLWCNERNGRQPVLDVVAALPADRVCELHLAGGEEHDGYLLDAHSGTIDPELVELAIEVASRLPHLRAVTFELIPDYVGPNGIDAAVLGDQLRQLHRIWAARGSRAPAPLRAAPSVVRGAASAWERELESAVRGPVAAGVLAADPAIPVYRELIGAVQRGNVVTALPLTYRLLVLMTGVAATDELLDGYVAAHPPHAWAYDEARQFQSFAEGVDCPHLAEVLAFELGAYEAVVTGERVRVRFTCEPHGLLDALRAGTPPDVVPGSYEIVVEPPRQAGGRKAD